MGSIREDTAGTLPFVLQTAGPELHPLQSLGELESVSLQLLLCSRNPVFLLLKEVLVANLPWGTQNHSPEYPSAVPHTGRRLCPHAENL